MNVLRLVQPHKDGVGAQLHRILSSHAISQYLGWKLHFDDLDSVDSQIFGNINVETPRWNKLIADIVTNRIHVSSESYRNVDISARTNLMRCLFAKYYSRLTRESTLIIISNPHAITDKHPAMFTYPKIQNLQFPKNSSSNINVTIAVHIRHRNSWAFAI